MFSRRVKSKFLLGAVTGGLVSSFCVSADIGGTIASGNSSISRFLNFGKSILFSRYFYVPAFVALALLVMYFYNKKSSNSGGSSEFVLKESEQEAQERNDAINKFFYERNVLPILKNIRESETRESETKEELLALREKFQRLERYQGVISPNEYDEITDLLYSPEETEEKGGHKYKKIIASIRILIKENFSVWADMCAGNFSSMEAKEKTKETAQKLTEGLLTLMKELQEKGQLQVNNKIDWDNKKIPISKKLESILEVKADGLKSLAQWTWKTWFIDHDIGYYEELKGNKKFVSVLKKKYRKISGWLSFSKDEVIDHNGKIRELNKERKFSVKDEYEFSTVKKPKLKQKQKKEKKEVIKDLNLGNRGIFAII